LRILYFIAYYTFSLHQLIFFYDKPNYWYIYLYIRVIVQLYCLYPTFDFVYLISLKARRQIASQKHCLYELVIVCEIFALCTIISGEKTIHTKKSSEVYYPVNIGTHNSWRPMHHYIIILLLYRVLHRVSLIFYIGFREKFFVPLCTHTKYMNTEAEIRSI